MGAFMGMRGTGDWVTDARPKSWREAILRRYPNGSAPLTAIMSKMGSERVTDPEYNWWTKALPLQGGSVTGIYRDVTLATAYGAAMSLGDTCYVKMAEALSKEFRIGHIVVLKDASDPTLTVNCRVTGRNSNGASSYLACKLLEDDDNGVGDLTYGDRIVNAGNSNAEGAAIPDAIAYDPTKWYNFTQIWRTPLEITRTAKLTRLRTGDAYREAKREALELHSIEMEKSLLFGIATETVGDNGKYERTTMGLIPAIIGGGTGHAGATEAGTQDHYVTNSDHSGQSWLAGGEEWLDTHLETVFRYGKGEKMAFCGSTTLLGINRLVKNGGTFQFNAKTRSYGIKVIEWVTAFGSIDLIIHPLLSYETTTRDAMIIFEPANLKFRYITDTMFKKDDRLEKGAWTATDGLKEEYLTEGGLEYHHPIGWAYLTGFNSANTA